MSQGGAKEGRGGIRGENGAPVVAPELPRVAARHGRSPLSAVAGGKSFIGIVGWATLRGRRAIRDPSSNVARLMPRLLGDCIFSLPRVYSSRR